VKDIRAAALTAAVPRQFWKSPFISVTPTLRDQIKGYSISRPSNVIEGWHKWRWGQGRYTTRREGHISRGRGRGEKVGRDKTNGSTGLTKCDLFYSWKVDEVEKKIDGSVRARAKRKL
jgi:hypothetical protein